MTYERSPVHCIRIRQAFSRPPSADMRDCDLWEDYSCPAGSCVIFTEALTHTGDTWTNEHADRLSLFTCYDTVNSKWGKDTTDPAVVLSLPPLRQTLFRGVWAEGSNKFYDAVRPLCRSFPVHGRGLTAWACIGTYVVGRRRTVRRYGRRRHA